MSLYKKFSNLSYVLKLYVLISQINKLFNKNYITFIICITCIILYLFKDSKVPERILRFLHTKSNIWKLNYGLYYVWTHIELFFRMDCILMMLFKMLHIHKTSVNQKYNVKRFIFRWCWKYLIKFTNFRYVPFSWL